MNLRHGRLRLSYRRGSRSGWALWSCHKVKRTGEERRKEKEKENRRKRREKERGGEKKKSISTYR